MDKLNPTKLKNPLPSGEISVREAMTVIYVSGVAGLVLSLLAGIMPFILTVTYMVLFLSYSNPTIRLKKRFLIKEGTLTVGLFLAIIIGSVAVGSLTPTVAFLGLFVSIVPFVGSPAFSDRQDMKEDKKFGVITLANVLVWKRQLEMLIAFVIVFMMLTPLTYINLGLNAIFPIISVFLSLLFLRFLFPVIVKYEYEGWRKAFKSGMIYWFGIQIAFILGSLPIFL